MIRFLFGISIIFCFLFTSCDKTQVINFHFSDGTEIKDTSDYQFLLSEFDSLQDIHKWKNQELKVYSSFNNLTEELTKNTADSLHEFVYTYLHNQNNTPKTCTVIDSINKKRNIIDYSFIVIENKSGRIVEHFTTPNDKEKDPMMKTSTIGKFKNVIGYSLLMKEGNDFDTKYVVPNTKNIRSYSEYEYFNHGNTIQHTDFQFISGITTPYYPYFNIDSSKLYSFLKNVDLYNEPFRTYWRGSNYSPAALLFLQSNLPELTTMMSIFKNDGVFRKNSAIDSICDQSGKRLYKRKNESIRVLDSDANNEMKKMFSLVTKRGFGISYYLNKGQNPSDIYYWSRSKNSSEFHVISNDNYTIGIRSFDCYSGQSHYDKQKHGVNIRSSMIISMGRVTAPLAIILNSKYH